MVDSVICISTAVVAALARDDPWEGDQGDRCGRLAAAAAEYLLALRMLDGVNAEAERRVIGELTRLRDELTGAKQVDSRLAALLADLIEATWAQSGPNSYRGEELERVQQSFATISHSALEVVR